MNHAETHFGNRNAEAEALDALLADLGVPNEPLEEIVEEVVYEHTIEAAMPEEKAAIEDEDAADPAVDATPDAATDDAKAVKQAEREAAKIKREAENVAKKIERDTLRAAKKAERESAKADRPTRKHYASKEERLTDKLGGFLVLTHSDAKLVGEELAAKQAETIEVLKGAGLKVQNRMTMLLEYVAGKNANGLNEVILRAVGLLKRDGHIKTGDKGNFHADLIAKPYSIAAARAMGNNTVAAMRNLQMIVKAEDGTYVPNPESIVLAKATEMLGF